MTSPERPSNVPASVIWLPDRNEFRDCPLVNGEAEGEARFYRPDGTLACIATYVAGTSNGPFTRFHQNGQPSKVGAMKAGKEHGLFTWHRPTDGSKTTEITLPDVCPPSVVEMRAEFVDGAAGPVHFLDANGVEVAPVTGEPIPARPEGVPARAWYDESSRRWFDGIGSQREVDRIGWWRWWNANGRLDVELRHGPGGKVIEDRRHHEGVVAVHHTIKSHDGTRELVLRYNPEGEPCTSEGEPLPPRPQGVPEDALLDTDYGYWLSGPRKEGGLKREGTWRWWHSDGAPRSEVDYVDGIARRERAFRRDGYEETSSDEHGRAVLKRGVEHDGNEAWRVEWTYSDGALQEHTLFTRGVVDARGRRTAAGLTYEFFDNGTLVVHGTLDADGRPIGTWRYVENGVEGSVDLDGPKRNRTIKIDEEFDPFAFLGPHVLARPELLTLEPLPGVRDIAWTELEACYSDNLEAFPRFLEALTSPSKMVRDAARREIYSETLHQGSVYEATAACVPFVAASLDRRHADPAMLLEWLVDVVLAADGYREAAEAWPEEARQRIVDVLEALAKSWPAIAKLLQHPDPLVRSRVVTLAGLLRDEQGSATLRIAASDGEPRIAQTAVYYLAAAPSTPVEEVAAFLRHPTALTRAVAAIGLADGVARGTSPAGSPSDVAVDVLVETLSRTDDAAAFSRLPFVQGRLVTYVALALAKLKTARARDQVLAIARAIGDVPIFDVEALSMALFSLCFADGKAPFPRDTVAALRTLAGMQRLNNFTNFMQVARQFGMPDSTNQLGELASRLEASGDVDAALGAHFAEWNTQNAEGAEGEDGEGEDGDEEDE